MLTLYLLVYVMIYCNNNVVTSCLFSPPYLHLATSDILHWCGGGNINRTLQYCVPLQWYKQFLQVSRPDRPLIMLGLVLCLPCVLYLCSSCCYIYLIFFVTVFALPFSELRLAVDLVD